jgi:two-component system, NarL family, response regulator NreC
MESRMTRILICDDHSIVRKGLRSLLDEEEELVVVGEAQSGREAVSMTQQMQPDVVLMDISMPELNGLEATRQIKQQQPQVRVLILTMHDNAEYVFEILKAGASGYVLKQSATTELILAIQAVSQGKTFLSPSISGGVIEGYLQHAKTIPTGDDCDLLTNREREVLQLIAEGTSTRVMARKLGISVKTIETHRTNIMRKLGSQNIADLIRYAIRKGLVAD